MWIFLAVPAFYAVLFLISGGLFGNASGFLKRHVFQRLNVGEDAIKTGMMVIFAANLLGALVTFSEVRSDTVSRGYLVRGDYGSETYTESLNLIIGGNENEVEVQVAPRKYSNAEIEEMFDQTEEGLQKAVLGGMPPSHVNQDVKLISTFGELPVSISWMTDRPEIIDWDGKIQDDISENGTKVVLTAEISFEEKMREAVLPLVVYPELLTAEEMLSGKIKEALEARNEGESGEKLYLPSEIDGSTVRWSKTVPKTGLLLLALGLIFSVLFIFSKIHGADRLAEKRRALLILDYPHIISKLVLLLGAGMSMRRTFEKLAADYQNSLSDGRKRRPGFEEVIRTCAEMNRGVPESEAYENLGKRAGEIQYKTLATLLVQNLRKGSRELIELLEQEASEAFEDRKKMARIAGEEAGTKLIFPMILMLAVVMAILMVPAFIQF